MMMGCRLGRHSCYYVRDNDTRPNPARRVSFERYMCTCPASVCALCLCLQPACCLLSNLSMRICVSALCRVGGE